MPDQMHAHASFNRDLTPFPHKTAKTLILSFKKRAVIPLVILQSAFLDSVLVIV